MHRSNLPRTLIASLLGPLLLSGCGGGPGEAATAVGPHMATIERYCLDCHNAAEATAGIVLEGRDPARVAEDAETWEAVVRKLQSHMMPPPGEPRPDLAAVDGLVAALTSALDAGENAFEPAGHVALHRLNRTEYANAIRDLIDLDIDPASLLPVDGSEAGFDNIANALLVTPVFIDQYISAARNLSAQAIGNPAPRAVGVPYNVSQAGQEFHVPGLPLGTRGGAVIEHYFPADGEYLLNIGDLVSGLWGFNQEHRNTLVALLDGEQFFELEIGGGEDLKVLDQVGAPAVDAINARLKNIPFRASAGPHRLGVTFLHRSFAESDRQLRSLVPGRGQDAVLTLGQLEIFGPVTATGLGATPSRNTIFSCYPQSAAAALPCAEDIINGLANRAFRGPVGAEDSARLLALYREGSAGGDFEQGIEFALAGILAHPRFLYRIEAPPAGAEPSERFAIGAPELAARLSFFLWSSVPDAALLEAASSGRLDDPAVLAAEVSRLLADPRSQTLASNFAFQWLALGELEAVVPDAEVFADISPGIRALMVTEANLFIDSLFREDRSILDLLTADHTFLNETLALHYGINSVRGAEFRRVELTEDFRHGLLGKAGVLMTTAYPNRTSPVLRGSWLLGNLLGTPPADPPPDVEALIETVAGETAATVRDRLEAHRSNPSCHSCHGVIDPLGFALENFDAVGRWRTLDRESGLGIDATGQLADGRSVDGPVALRGALLERPDRFLLTFTEKLMTYAIGRSLDYRDMPTIRRIVREAAAEDYRFSAIVRGIIASPQFRLQQVPPAAG